MSAARDVPFDERLPLYSWLEDLDFCRRMMARHGRVVKAMGVVAVHQGSNSGGRVAHQRLGYSQVANYVYLHRKGSAHTTEAWRLVARPVLACLVGSVVGDNTMGR